jgi:acyl carrier protein
MAKELKTDRYVNSNEPEQPENAGDCNCQLDQVRSIAELQRTLQRHIASTLGLPVQFVTPFTRFAEDLGLDVWSTLELVLSMEALLKIQLPDAEAARVNCVKDFLDSLSNTVFRFIER